MTKETFKQKVKKVFGEEVEFVEINDLSEEGVAQIYELIMDYKGKRYKLEYRNIIQIARDDYALSEYANGKWLYVARQDELQVVYNIAFTDNYFYDYYD